MCGSSLNVYGLTTAISHELEYIHATPLFSAAKCIHILAKQSFFHFYKFISSYLHTIAVIVLFFMFG